MKQSLWFAKFGVKSFLGFIQRSWDVWVLGLKILVCCEIGRFRVLDSTGLRLKVLWFLCSGLGLLHVLGSSWSLRVFVQGLSLRFLLVCVWNVAVKVSGRFKDVEFRVRPLVFFLFKGSEFFSCLSFWGHRSVWSDRWSLGDTVIICLSDSQHVPAQTCSPAHGGRTRRKNRNKRVKWKRINEGDYSGGRQESWSFSLKTSSTAFSLSLLYFLSVLLCVGTEGWRDGWMGEGWGRVFSPMTLALISKFFLPERWRSERALHPFLFISIHLFRSICSPPVLICLLNFSALHMYLCLTCRLFFNLSPLFSWSVVLIVRLAFFPHI